jgi:hypothetical protein
MSELRLPMGDIMKTKKTTSGIMGTHYGVRSESHGLWGLFFAYEAYQKGEDHENNIGGYSIMYGNICICG